MEVKKREFEREIQETEYEEGSIHTILFTAGTGLGLMLFLKRLLVEQWRAWVFLILNLILLAILFMSLRPNCWVWTWNSASAVNDVEEVNKNRKTKRFRPCGCSEEIEEGKECHKKKCWSSSNDIHDQNERDEDEEEETKETEEEVPRLSKEELNERVEAFITMFRQHLVLDAKQAENFRF